LRGEYDPAKRAASLAARRLDIADAAAIWAGPTLTVPDMQRNYGELRFVTARYLHGRMGIAVWTDRIDARRIISLKKANAREQAAYRASL
jgi:hypothetical protein